MSEALKRIEEKHLMRYAAAWPTIARCSLCVSPDYPCDVVKLARALDDIIRWSIDDNEACRICYADVARNPHFSHCSVGNAERTLKEMAGE